MGDTTYVFQYGVDASYGSQTDMSPSIGSDDTAHAVTSVLGGLTPGTTYHFRAVAINFGGTTPGPDVTCVPRPPDLRMWMRPRPPI